MKSQNYVTVQTKYGLDGKAKNAKKLSDNGKTSEIIFLTVILVIPVTQFVLMYIGVNFNSILLAFKDFNISTGYFEWKTSSVFSNFIEFFIELGTVSQQMRIVNSLWMFLLGILVSTPLSLIASYTLWRKIPGYKIFQIVLFMPSIISSIVLVIIARQFITFVMPATIHTPMDLLTNIDTGFWTVSIYGVLMGLGPSIVMYLGAMSNINESVVEYAKLDGMGYFGEFVHVVFPSVYGTFSTYMILSITVFFTNYGSFYAFFRPDGGMLNQFQTLGYYYFIEVVNLGKEVAYPKAATAGLVFTCVALPLTFFARKLLNKLRPTEE